MLVARALFSFRVQTYRIQSKLDLWPNKTHFPVSSELVWRTQQPEKRHTLLQPRLPLLLFYYGGWVNPSPTLEHLTDCSYYHSPAAGTLMRCITYNLSALGVLYCPISPISPVTSREGFRNFPFFFVMSVSAFWSRSRRGKRGKIRKST